MLAIGRALMRSPKLIMLDEPSLGLAPMAVNRTFDAIRKVRDAGTAVLISEQNTHHALEVADRAVVINRGQIVATGSPEVFRDPEVMTKLYLNH
jgi:branched-chain amino acid transport system ATP-binding protein